MAREDGNDGALLGSSSIQLHDNYIDVKRADVSLPTVRSDEMPIVRRQIRIEGSPRPAPNFPTGGQHPVGRIRGELSVSNLAEVARTNDDNVVAIGRTTSTIPARHLLLVGAVLPFVVLAGGYLMWIVPARQLYGQLVSSELSLRAIAEPGLLYLGTLVLAAMFAIVLGITRLQRPLRYLSRTTMVVGDLVFWFCVAVMSGAIAYTASYDRSFGVILDPATSYVYMFFHVVLVGFGFRRVYGLLRSRLAAPVPDRRSPSSGLRLLEAGLVVALLFAQAPLAILFGGLGPNPAKRVRAVDVHMEASIAPTATRWLLYIDENENRLLGFDPGSNRVVGIPKDRIAELQWARTSE